MIDDEQLSAQPLAEQPAEPLPETNAKSKSRPKSRSTSRSKGIHPVVLILIGVAVFVVCSYVQSAGGSSMFTTSPPPPNSPTMRVLVQATWWPGWFISVAFILAGVSGWWKRRRQA